MQGELLFGRKVERGVKSYAMQGVVVDCVYDHQSIIFDVYISVYSMSLNF